MPSSILNSLQLMSPQIGVIFEVNVGKVCVFLQGCALASDMKKSITANNRALQYNSIFK